jgi:hypothetical protein
VFPFLGEGQIQAAEWFIQFSVSFDPRPRPSFPPFLMMLSSLLPIGISNALNSSVETLFFSVLQSICTGRLEIKLLYSPSERLVSFGDSSPTAAPVARLTVKDPDVWWQLCGNMDLVSVPTLCLRLAECRVRIRPLRSTPLTQFIFRPWARDI